MGASLELKSKLVDQESHHRSSPGAHGPRFHPDSHQQTAGDYFVVPVCGIHGSGQAQTQITADQQGAADSENAADNRAENDGQDYQFHLRAPFGH